MSLSNEQKSALHHARHLAENGVRLFLARPDGNGGHLLPSGWQKIAKADPRVVDRWQPGFGLAAVGGDVIDVVDVDPRNGGDRSAASLAEVLPNSYGRQTTPSGGTHDLIATLHVHKAQNVLPGVDVQAGVNGEGCGFVWLAPTERKSKVDGKVRAYRWTQAPDISMLTLVGGDVSGMPLAAFVEARQRPTYDGPDYDGPVFEELSDDQKFLAVGEVLSAESHWERRFAEALTWGEGVQDEHGRGWEALSASWAWAVAKMAAAPYLPLDEDQARALHDRVLPDEFAADEKCKGKFTDSLIRKAASTPVEPPPWDDLARVMSAGLPVSTEEYDAFTMPNGTVDLRAIAAGIKDGTITLDTPEVGGLFYRGKISALFGSSTAGKTWVALDVVLRHYLETGERSVYVDAEDSPKGFATRALQMDERLLDAMVYFPAQGGSPDMARLADVVREVRAGIVVLDSLGEMLAGNGKDSNAEKDVTEWFAHVARPLASLGPAVILIDHVAKTQVGEATQVGSFRKQAALDGVQFFVKSEKPFSRHREGFSVLKASKDRPGFFTRGAVSARYDFTPGPDGALSVLATVGEDNVPQKGGTDWDGITNAILTFVKEENAKRGRVDENGDPIQWRPSKTYIRDNVKGFDSKKVSQRVLEMEDEELLEWDEVRSSKGRNIRMYRIPDDIDIQAD